MLHQVGEATPNVVAVKASSETRFVTPEYVAERYGLEIQTVYKLISEGEIPCLRLGARSRKRPPIRIPLEALIASEQAQLAQSRKKAA
jgi:excisionase family DNA binding protein